MAPDTLYLLKGELLYENAVQLHVLVEWRSNDQQVGREILYNVGGIPPDGITAGAWMPFEVMFRSPGGIDEGRIHIWHGVINNQTNVPGGQFCADNFWLSTVIE